MAKDSPITIDGRSFSGQMVCPDGADQEHIDCPCWATGTFEQVPCPWHDGHHRFPAGAFEAHQRLATGQRPHVSTGIHGYITRGYGNLDEMGFWEFPLPDGEYVGC